MGYTLENIDTRRQYRCGDGFWAGVLEEAHARGWRGEGTSIDFQRDVAEEWDDSNSYLWNLFLLINIHMHALEWDGNYTGKEGQVVSGDDAQELLYALEGSRADPAFLEFIAGGGFRILP